jgi:hypothetical protein
MMVLFLERENIERKISNFKREYSAFKRKTRIWGT